MISMQCAPRASGMLSLTLALVGRLAASAIAGPLVLHVAPHTAVDGSAGAPTESWLVDGSELHPFRSVSAARDALRSMQPLPIGGATVLLHAGVHAGFALGPADAGRAGSPVTYIAAPGEDATVSGGVSLPGKAFKPWSGGSPGVLQADLSKFGITAEMLGGMRTDSMTCVGDCQHNKSDLFLGGQGMTLARYPNKAADGAWRFLFAELGGGGSFGRFSTSGPWFLMSGVNASRIESWAAKDHDAWLHGYWGKDWADCYRKLASAVDVTVNGTQYTNVSFEAITHNPGTEGVDKHARFYGVNLLSELDSPMEYEGMQWPKNRPFPHFQMKDVPSQNMYCAPEMMAFY